VLTVPARTAPAAALAVVVPAHDEELLVRQCLESVRAALAGSGLPAVIVLVAHRCTDRTVELARAVLSGPDEHVLLDDSPTVATARAAGVTRAMAAMAAWPQGLPPAEQCWLLSTDADSVVPPSWVTDLRRYLGSGPAAVAGLVDVHGWEGASASALETYRTIVAAGMRMAQHDHV
jgi:glycosyltransferase involved in cell wall biosynthesis